MLLNPTPSDQLCDQQGRPYFLWDSDTTLDAFKERLAHAEPCLRAYWLAKLMRQARPDDALTFATPEEMARNWGAVAPYLGRSRPFWSWLLRRWQLLHDAESS